MSEEIKYYGPNAEDKTKLLFLAKRLADVAKDFDELSDKDKRFVIERVDKLTPSAIVELYNALLEYMD